jgi:hypothetical protein
VFFVQENKKHSGRSPNYYVYSLRREYHKHLHDITSIRRICLPGDNNNNNTNLTYVYIYIYMYIYTTVLQLFVWFLSYRFVGDQNTNKTIRAGVDVNTHCTNCILDCAYIIIYYVNPLCITTLIIYDFLMLSTLCGIILYHVHG